MSWALHEMQEEVVWALLSNRGDVCSHVPLQYWDIAGLPFQGGRSQKGKETCPSKEDSYFPTLQDWRWSASPYQALLVAMDFLLLEATPQVA